MKKSFGGKVWVLTLAAILMISGVLFAGGKKDAGTDSIADGKLRIAMLLPGPINDGGWNTMAYTALMEAEKTLGADVAYTENVKQNDQVQLLRQYASRGYTVMIGHGFEFGDALTQVGEEFPDKYFINYGGAIHNGKNVGSINYAYGQTGALMGVLVGMHKDITRVGVIHAFDNPTGSQETRNIEKYAKKYNPNVTFTYTFTGDWDDIAKAKEAAAAALNNGAQVIVTDMSGPTGAIIQAVQDRNAKFIEVTFDAYDMCPGNIISSAIHDATKAMLAALKEIQAGNFDGSVYKFGLKEGVMDVGRFGPSVTDEMKAEVAKMRKEIEDGTAELLILLED
ncbi:MAG: BMP family protein [Treponema sp.]|jgi:basic membrane protein A|nr:BMP family protein [Treponema sp.]